MEESALKRVVLRYRDGHAIRCTLTTEFAPSAQIVEAETADGDMVKVEVDALKAVFFLKDPQKRDADMVIGRSDTKVKGGAMARVEFFDGEVIHGRMESYSVADSGFYLYPSSLESNSQQIFVVARALNTLSIEG
jgi:hypothetical protein